MKSKGKVKVKVEVFDARHGGRFPNAYDRYTVIITRKGAQCGSVYTMSADPMNPQGVNMYYGPSCNLARPVLGKQVELSELPDAVRRAIKLLKLKEGGV